MEKNVIDSFRGDYAFLSNFYPSPLKVSFSAFVGDSFLLPTAEHMFQSAKVEFCTLSSQEKFNWLRDLANTSDPKHAKQLGKSISIDVQAWNKASYRMMEQVLTYKFAIHSELRELLLETGDATLIEGNTWGDMLWGQVDGVGQNLLGKILMDIRESYKA